MAFFDTINIRVYYLAFVVYWGILLFGYDTGVAGGGTSPLVFLHYYHHLTFFFSP
jgi:hypothetical protein